MPKEIKNVDEFIRLSEKAESCIVKKIMKNNVVKLKLKTKRYLYTLKVNETEVKAILEKVKCRIVEVG
ncbi:MAG: 60S ribosomal protein L38 [Candidatus Bathyarchaeota archaeon]|nr:60S ribosomal protein L38 [Candidatus Bathyarchaeota archaeon]